MLGCQLFDALAGRIVHKQRDHSPKHFREIDLAAMAGAILLGITIAMPTIRDVAREAGVSIASASRALNGLSNVTDEMRNKVWAAANKLQFVPHSGARSLTRKKSDAIGVILPDLFGEYFSEIVRGIDRAAHRAGLQLLLGNMHGNAHETTVAIRAMHGRVDGLIVMPTEVDVASLTTSLPPGAPVVMLNCDSRDLSVPSVAIDNYSGAYQMTRALVAAGYRRIAHIAGPKLNRDAQERLRGFSDAMSDLVGNQSPLILAGDFSEEAGVQAARLLVYGGMAVDAVFAANDMMAVGCMMTLKEMGRDVPGEVAVAGFDDIPLARFVSPALTTMRVNMAELGEIAAMMLIDRIKNASVDMLQSGKSTQATRIIVPEFVQRGSSRSQQLQSEQNLGSSTVNDLKSGRTP